MTIDIDAIRQREQAATTGPWWAWDRGVGWHIAVGVDEHGRPLRYLPEGERTDISREADAEFIAHARTDVPALCDEIERLRAESAADIQSLNDDLSAVRTERDALAAKVAAFKPAAFPSGEQLYAHRCNNVEWWHEPTQGPINEQGCDACESAPDGGWQSVYVREAAD